VMAQPLVACQSERSCKVVSQGELVPTALYLFIEKTSGTDIIDNVLMHSHWLGDQRTSYGGVWSANLLAPEASNSDPSRHYLA